MFFSTTSMPVTRAPRRAIDSDRMPPPQPMSRMLRSASGASPARAADIARRGRTVRRSAPSSGGGATAASYLLFARPFVEALIALGCRDALWNREDIARYADLKQFPLIPCNLCGSQPNLQRQAIKEMLTEWKKRHPGRIENIFRAIANVSPSQLADRELFDFAGLGVSGTGVPETSDWTMPERKRIELNVIN